MIRKVIKIDEDKCDGCGLCIPSCHEGALQIIDGKAKLVKDSLCDGFGACIGECPLGAITFEERETEGYNEIEVLERLLHEPDADIKAHLMHLFDMGDLDNFNIAVHYLEEIGIKINIINKGGGHDMPTEKSGGGCPGAAPKKIFKPLNVIEDKSNKQKKSDNNSELEHWPVQLHLVNPGSDFLQGKTLILMSTCAPVAYGNIQQDYIKNNAVVLACPKLDYTEPYQNKLAQIIATANLVKIIVLRMEVPCCSGLTDILKKAYNTIGIPLPIEEHTIGINGSSAKIKYIN